jgi:hypothetical protein
VGCATVGPPAERGALVEPAAPPPAIGEWAHDTVEPLELTESPADAGSAARELPEFLRQFEKSWSSSLLGAVASRRSGWDGTSQDVHLERVALRTTIAGGFAYTEIEEELANPTGNELEAIVSFRAPLGGVIARLGLWVGNELIDAEVVERKHAETVYRSIVEATRDPALLEQDPSGRVTLRVFPLPPRSSRRMLVGYAQPLEREGDLSVFRLGLKLAESEPPLREFSATIELAGVERDAATVVECGPTSTVTPSDRGTRVGWSAHRTRPVDCELSFAGAPPSAAVFTPLRTKSFAERFVSLRVSPELGRGTAPRDASIWVIDTSASQAGPALRTSKALVDRLLAELPASRLFAIFACDTACSSFPRAGLTATTTESRRAARRFVAGLDAGGATDLGYALLEGVRRARAGRHSELVYFGDARPSAGDLDTEGIVARLTERAASLDLRFVGIGPELDSESLGDLAASLRAARLALGVEPGDSGTIARWLQRPVLREPRVDLPPGLERVYPQQAPNHVQGDDLVLLARLRRDVPSALRVVVTGSRDTDGGLERHRAELTLELPPRAIRADTVPRLWARARLRDLDGGRNHNDDDDETARYYESIELSKRYQVLSRHTAFLALESDAMFREFDIERQRGLPDFSQRPVGASAPRHVGFAPRLPLPFIRAPKVRMAGTYISGRLPRQVIHRVVRNNDGRFRACYHQGLLRNPALAGTVRARFVIGRDGRVANSIDGGSTLPDPAVTSCIVEAFKAVVFPAPDSPVTVVYPFVLSPSTQKETRMMTAPRRHGAWRVPAASLEDDTDEDASLESAEPATRVSAEELAARVELAPTNPEHQLAAAHAYEAEHDERRACAHFRAAAALAPRDLEIQYQALRCRARVLDERMSVLADLNRLGLSSPRIEDLAARLRSLAPIPAYAAER